MPAGIASIKSDPENEIWTVIMLDAEFVLGYLTPRVFFLAMCMHLINSVLLPIGNKGILDVLNNTKGNEKEQDEIERAIRKLGWRYLPVILFLLVSLVQINLFLDLKIVRVVHLFLMAWTMLYNWNILGFNINALGGFLNMLVCAVNKGMMPTIYPPELDGRHILMTDATNLNFLCDWIVCAQVMISIGDVLIAAGSLIFLVCQFYIFIRFFMYREAQ